MVTSRIRFTATQKAELWERWKNGQSAAAISRALERKNKTGVERIVVVYGGIVPAPRQRALAALRLEEREEISRGIAVGRPIRQIAQRLRRAPSTVSREIKRNRWQAGLPVQTGLINVRWERALRPKLCRLALHEGYDGAWRKLALAHGRRNRSPAGLKQKFSTDQDMQISHEAIYRSLFIQTRGVLKKELTAQLRTARRMRRPKNHNAQSGQGHILDMVSTFANGRPRLRIAPCQGIGRGDLLTEGRTARTSPPSSRRNTRFAMLVKISPQGYDDCRAALARHISKLPEELRRSLTLGSRQRDAMPTGASPLPPTFRSTSASRAVPGSAAQTKTYQRPTASVLSEEQPTSSRISQRHLNAVALRLNQRPRKTLGFETPADRLQKVLH